MEKGRTARMKWMERARSWRGGRLARELVRRYFQDGVSRNAAELAYFLLFSLFPPVIFLSRLLGSFQTDVQEWETLLRGVVPREVLEILLHYLAHIQGVPASGLRAAGLLMAIWSAARAMRSLSGAVNLAYRAEERHGGVLAFLKSVGAASVFLAAFLLSAVLILLGPRTLAVLGRYLHLEIRRLLLFRMLRPALLFLLLFGFLLGIYRWIPGRRMTLRRVMPGALAAALSWLVGSAAFSYYVEHMGRYSVLYGSIGAVVVLLLWLYLTAVVLIMGAEWNAVLGKMEK